MVLFTARVGLALICKDYGQAQRCSNLPAMKEITSCQMYNVAHKSIEKIATLRLPQSLQPQPATQKTPTQKRQ